MNIHPVRSTKAYKAALRGLSAYFDHEPEPGTEEGDRFETLATLVEAYEVRHLPIEAPTPPRRSGSEWIRDCLSVSKAAAK